MKSQVISENTRQDIAAMVDMLFPVGKIRAILKEIEQFNEEAKVDRDEQTAQD